MPRGEPVFLARVWLKGRGCVHLRSADMPAAYASRLLARADAEIEKHQDSDEPRGFSPGLVPDDHAKIKLRRLTDPDHPGRSAPNFVIGYYSSYLDALGQNASTRFEQRLDSALRYDPDAGRSPWPGSGGKGPAWMPLDLGNSSKPTARELGSASRKPRFIAVISAFLIATGVVAFLWRRTGPATSANRDNPPPPRSEGPKEFDQRKGEWDDLQPKIKEVLAQEWAIKIVGKSGDLEAIDDKQLLIKFTNLMKRPDVGSILKDPADFRQYNDMKIEGHPFRAFMERLPDLKSIPSIAEVDNHTNAMDYLEKVWGELKMPGDRRELQYAHDKFVDSVKAYLSYDVFFKEWPSVVKSKYKDGKWDDRGDTAPDWVRRLEGELQKYSNDSPQAMPSGSP